MIVVHGTREFERKYGRSRSRLGREIVGGCHADKEACG